MKIVNIGIGVYGSSATANGKTRGRTISVNAISTSRKRVKRMNDYEKGISDAITALLPLLECSTEFICDTVSPLLDYWCCGNCKDTIRAECVRKYIQIILKEREREE